MIIRRNKLYLDISRPKDVVVILLVFLFSLLGFVDFFMVLCRWLFANHKQVAEAAAVFMFWWSVKPEMDRLRDKEDRNVGS